MTKPLKFLFLSQALANFGDIFLRLVIIANIYQLTNSVIASSVVPILIGGSSFLSSFFLPIVARRIPLNKLFYLSQVGKTLLLVALACLLVFPQRIPLLGLYGLMSSISLLDGLMGPVAAALVPIYTKDLVKANTLLTFINESIQLIGWGLGGLLFVLLSLPGNLGLILSLYLLASLLSSRLPAISKNDKIDDNNLTELFKGWRLILNTPVLKFILSMNLLEIFANTLWVSSIILVFVADILHQTEKYWGYGNTSYSVGILVSAYLTYKVADWLLAKKWQSMAASLCLASLMTLALLIFPRTDFFLLATLSIGFLTQFKELPQTLLVQQAVSEDRLVNIYSAFEVIATLSFSGSVLLMSFLVQKWGIAVGIYLTAFVLLVEGLIVILNRQILTDSK